MNENEQIPGTEPVKKGGKKNAQDPAAENTSKFLELLEFLRIPENRQQIAAAIGGVIAATNDFTRMEQEKKWEEIIASDDDREIIPLTPEEKKRRVEDSFKRDRIILIRECYIALLHRNTMIEPADVQQAAEKHADHLINVFRADFEELDAMRNDDLPAVQS